MRPDRLATSVLFGPFLGLVVGSLIAACGGSRSTTQPSSPIPVDPLPIKLTISIDSLGSSVAIVNVSEVTFEARDTPGDRLQYEMQFEDGASASTARSTHVYSKEGT